MRQGQHNNKNRNRNRGRRPNNPLSRVYESNGPDVKVRGTAQHVAEKYLQLARDAQSSGNLIMAESYYQFAEHYLRIVAAAQPFTPHQGAMGGQRRFDDYDEGDEEADGDERDERPAAAVQSQPAQPAAQPAIRPLAYDDQPDAGEPAEGWDGPRPSFLSRESAPQPAFAREPAAEPSERPRRGRRPGRPRTANGQPEAAAGDGGEPAEAPANAGTSPAEDFSAV